MAYEIAPDGVIGVNCMVAVSNYDDIVRAACEAGVKLIISGAGLPMNLPGLTVDFPEVALVPIVSSVKAAELIARKWLKGYDRLPDAVVVEDPDTAGGHLGEKIENIGSGEYDQYETVRGVKPTRKRSRSLPPAVSGIGPTCCMPWNRGPMVCRWPAALSVPRSAMPTRPSNRPISIASRTISV